jgi:inositol-phosphate phosphatase/L-galactose 1-phosphate phosphatase/histidinol-phosphatase
MPPRATPPAPSAAAPAAAGAVRPEHIELAHALADAAAVVTSRYFRTPVPVDIKADASPVTIADQQAEAAMQALIKGRFPEHSIFGEEEGFHAGSGDGSYMWVIDPIDGTKSFITGASSAAAALGICLRPPSGRRRRACARPPPPPPPHPPVRRTGKPLFGTLIALLHDGVPVLGIIDQPILKERWLGVAGAASTLNGAPIATRACPQLASAYLYATTPHMFAGDTAPAFARVRDAVRIPLYGCDCYAYGLLAAGHCDLVVEADLKPYDYMALVPVIQGAGGVVTDWAGRQLRFSAADARAGAAFAGEVVAAGDAACHAQALEALAWGQR